MAAAAVITKMGHLAVGSTHLLLQWLAKPLFRPYLKINVVRASEVSECICVEVPSTSRDEKRSHMRV